MAPGIPELIIIGGIAVFLFGATKIPALAKAAGESVRNFRAASKQQAPDATDTTEATQ